MASTTLSEPLAWQNSTLLKGDVSAAVAALKQKGGGKRVFGNDGVLRQLRLVDSRVTTTGAILATYAPAGR